MPYNKNKRKYNNEYAKHRLKRVPLDMQLWQYDRLKSAADFLGEPVNTFIKKAIAMRIDSLKSDNQDDESDNPDTV